MEIDVFHLLKTLETKIYNCFGGIRDRDSSICHRVLLVAGVYEYDPNLSVVNQSGDKPGFDQPRLASRIFTW